MDKVSNVNNLSAEDYDNSLYGLRALYIHDGVSAHGVLMGKWDEPDGVYIAVKLPNLNITLLVDQIWINCAVPVSDGVYLVTEANEKGFKYQDKENIFH